MLTKLKTILKSDYHPWFMAFVFVFTFVICIIAIYAFIFWLTFSERGGQPDEVGYRWWVMGRVSLYLCVLHVPYLTIFLLSARLNSLKVARVLLIGIIMTVSTNLLLAIIIFSSEELGTGTLNDEEQAVIKRIQEDCDCDLRFYYDPSPQSCDKQDSLRITLHLDYYDSRDIFCLRSEDELIEKGRAYSKDIVANFDLCNGYHSISVDFYLSNRDRNKNRERLYCDRGFSFDIRTFEVIKTHESGMDSRIESQEILGIKN